MPRFSRRSPIISTPCTCSGVLRQQQGNGAEAARLIGAALKMNPRSVHALCNFGAVLNTLNRHDEALAAYDQALAVEPGHIEALCKRGSVLLAARTIRGGARGVRPGACHQA